MRANLASVGIPRVSGDIEPGIIVPRTFCMIDIGGAQDECPVCVEHGTALMNPGLQLAAIAKTSVLENCWHISARRPNGWRDSTQELMATRTLKTAGINCIERSIPHVSRQIRITGVEADRILARPPSN
jgi:hypothetical protein